MGKVKTDIEKLAESFSEDRCVYDCGMQNAMCNEECYDCWIKCLNEKIQGIK